MCKEHKVINDIIIDNLHLINFINLSEGEKRMVLLWRNNIIIRKRMFNPRKIVLKEHNSFIEKLKKNTSNKYWLIRNNKNYYIGVIYLTKIDLAYLKANIGLYVNPEYIGKGYGKILIDCLKKIAIDKLSLSTLQAEVLSDNIPAINLYKAFGFKQILHRKISLKEKNGLADVMIMEYIKE